MHKIIFVIAFVSFFNIDLLADTPGKPVMHSSTVTFQGVKQIAGYTFYWEEIDSGKPDTITTDRSVYMAASAGRPFMYRFWGINDINRRSTDTIHFLNHYSPDYVVILEKVKEDSIYCTQKELSNANTIVSEGNTDSIANKQLIADAKSAKQKHYTKIGLFVLAGLAALSGIVVFFIRRKKKSTATQGTGS